MSSSKQSGVSSGGQRSVSKSTTNEALQAVQQTGGAPLTLGRNGLEFRPLKPPRHPQHDKLMQKQKQKQRRGLAASESAPSLKQRKGLAAAAPSSTEADDMTEEHQQQRQKQEKRRKAAAAAAAATAGAGKKAYVTPRTRWNLGPEATLDDLMALAEKQTDVHNAWRRRVEHFLDHHEADDEAYFRAQAEDLQKQGQGTGNNTGGHDHHEAQHEAAMSLRHKLMHRHDVGVMSSGGKGGSGGPSAGVAAMIDMETGHLKSHIGPYSTSDLMRLFRACRSAPPPAPDAEEAAAARALEAAHVGVGSPKGSPKSPKIPKSPKSPMSRGSGEGFGFGFDSDSKKKKKHDKENKPAVVGLDDDGADDAQHPPHKRMVDLTALLEEHASAIDDSIVIDALTRLKRRYVGKAGHTIETPDMEGASTASQRFLASHKHKPKHGEDEVTGSEHVVLASAEDVFRAAFPLLRATEARDCIGAVHLHEKMDREVALQEEFLAAAAIDRIPPHKLRQLRALFTLYDIDGSGLVSATEIATALQANHKKAMNARDFERGVEDDISSVLSLQEIDALVEKFDRDGNRELDENEFILAFQDVI